MNAFIHYTCLSQHYTNNHSYLFHLSVFNPDKYEVFWTLQWWHILQSKLVTLQLPLVA